MIVHSEKYNNKNIFVGKNRQGFDLFAQKSPVRE